MSQCSFISCFSFCPGFDRWLTVTWKYKVKQTPSSPKLVLLVVFITAREINKKNRGTIGKYYSLNGWNKENLFSHSFGGWNPKSKCWCICFFSLMSFACLLIIQHMFFLLCVCTCLYPSVNHMLWRSTTNQRWARAIMQGKKYHNLLSTNKDSSELSQALWSRESNVLSLSTGEDWCPSLAGRVHSSAISPIQPFTHRNACLMMTICFT